jgi:three-Cys-motif partner protein
MIAIDALRDAQKRIAEAPGGKRQKVRLFFCENDRRAYAKLSAAVAPFNKPDEDFEIQTYCGDFEEAVPTINAFIGNSFPLIFIDPTGWTGFSFDKIDALFNRRKVEVLINFMYDHINRAASMPDPKTIASLNPILDGEGWEARLDPTLPRGRAVEQLFRDSLQNAGTFDFVVSTKIDKSTADRPHFFIAYATKSHDGLKTFREAEHAALKVHVRDRAIAKERKKAAKSEEQSLFPEHFAEVSSDAHEASLEEIVEDQKEAATEALVEWLQEMPKMHFARVWAGLLAGFMLRVTNVKDICCDLAEAGVIENTWGLAPRKPQDHDWIILRKVKD